MSKMGWPQAYTHSKAALMAAKTRWQATSWMLERRYPNLFGKATKPPGRNLVEFETPIRDDDD